MLAASPPIGVELLPEPRGRLFDMLASELLTGLHGAARVPGSLVVET